MIGKKANVKRSMDNETIPKPTKEEMIFVVNEM